MVDLANSSPTAAEFPDEPFPCPHCGQMLASSVRVCVACKQPIEPHQIARPAPPPPPALRAPEAGAESARPLAAQRARFSWSIFFGVLGVWMMAAFVSLQFLGYAIGQAVLEGIVLLSSLWVLWDAQKTGVPKPFRWGIGSLLLWIIVFPWYLSRRRTPRAACPFIEAEAGPVARALLFVLIVFFLISAFMLIFKR